MQPSYVKQSLGFNLLEVLVAILILSLGMLSISHITSNALNEIAENEARSMALHVATKNLEPLYIAANNGMAAFKTALVKYNTEHNHNIITQTNNRNNYILFITAAQDNSVNPKNLLSDNLPETWKSPITIGVKIVYNGKNKIKTAYAPFVFVIS